MKKQLLSIHHFIVAVILITKGYDKIEHHHDFIGWTILSLGLLILTYFVFTKITNKSHSLLGLIIHLFESIALMLTTYVYFQEGKTLLPYVTLIAGVGFLVATYFHFREYKKHSTSKLI